MEILLDIWHSWAKLITLKDIYILKTVFYSSILDYPYTKVTGWLCVCLSVCTEGSR